MSLPTGYTSFNELKDYKVISSDPTYKYQQRVPNPYSKRTFTISYENATQTIKDSVLASYTGNPPAILVIPDRMGGGSIPVIFKEDLQITRTSNLPTYSITTTLDSVGPRYPYTDSLTISSGDTTFSLKTLSPAISFESLNNVSFEDQEIFSLQVDHRSGIGLTPYNLYQITGNSQEVYVISPNDFQEREIRNFGNRLEVYYRDLTINSVRDASYSVKLTAQILSGYVDLSCSVTPGTTYRTRAIDYPIFKISQRDSADVLQTPYFGGSVITSPWTGISRTNVWHPNLTMQNWSYFNLLDSNDSLYWQTTDASGYNKNYIIHATGDGLKFLVKNIPSLVGETGTYSPTYTTRLQSFTGNWYDAAQIYRTWSVPRFCHRGTIDTATSGKSSHITGVSLVAWMGISSAYQPSIGAVSGRFNSFNVFSDELLKLRNFFSGSILSQWYGWHNNEFDGNWPDYSPLPSTFYPAIRYVKTGMSNVYVLPYSHMSWGSNTPSYTGNNIFSLSVKKRDLGPLKEPLGVSSYNSVQPSVINPLGRTALTGAWSTLIAGTGANTNIDGLYLDFWAGLPPYYDYRYSGDTSLWVSGNDVFMGQMYNMISGYTSQPIITSEGIDENYIDSTSLLFQIVQPPNLAGPTNTALHIPMWKTVYGNYSLVSDTLGGPGIASSGAIQQVINKYFYDIHWGKIPSISYNFDSGSYMFLNNPASNTAYYPFWETLKNTLSQHETIRKYAWYGRRLRPENIVTEASASVVPPDFMSSYWLALDSKVGYIATNGDDSAYGYTWTLNPGNYPIPNSGTIYDITSGGNTFLITYNGVTDIDMSIPARSLRIYTFV